MSKCQELVKPHGKTHLSWQIRSLHKVQNKICDAIYRHELSSALTSTKDTYPDVFVDFLRHFFLFIPLQQRDNVNTPSSSF